MTITEAVRRLKPGKIATRKVWRKFRYYIKMDRHQMILCFDKAGTQLTLVKEDYLAKDWIVEDAR